MPLDLNDPENRKIFFTDTSRLIARLRTKIKIDDDRVALETAYAHLIRHILRKSGHPLPNGRGTTEDLPDIAAYIEKFDFSNLKNEIFGFVYENFLKDLHGKKNHGQFFTDPAVVDFMLNELGYTAENLAKDKTRMSIIDPACGAGTFLYSAADRIIEAFGEEKLVHKNICGYDTKEFPLFLAEMSLLMRLLPIMGNDNIGNTHHFLKTKDSISEFLDNRVLSPGGRQLPIPQFDFVIGNPPYIGYNECCRQGIEFTKRIKKKNSGITLADVYGVNLHSVPGVPKKYSPKPNIYAFFIALGLALLKENGKLCYIIPQTLLTAGDLDVLRYHLATQTTMESMMTFDENLFIGRGRRQNKSVATSSLIIIVQKKMPHRTHQVKVTNYKPCSKIAEEDTKGGRKEFQRESSVNFSAFRGNSNRETKNVLQSDLLAKIENWNFLLYDSRYADFVNAYVKNSLSIEDYRRNILADYNEICIDGGVKLDKSRITTEQKGDQYRVFNPKNNSVETYRARETNLFYDKSETITFLQCTQGMRVFNNRYKILWRTRFNNRFQFSEEPDLILHNNQTLMLSSDNRSELLFLFGLLNSRLSLFMLEKTLKMPNESTFIVAMKSIKKNIRVPRITPKNRKFKDKIVAKIETMLAFEDRGEYDKRNAIMKEIDALVFTLYSLSEPPS